jgi:hypothetical protein
VGQFDDGSVSSDITEPYEWLAVHFRWLPAISSSLTAFRWLCEKDTPILELRYRELEPKRQNNLPWNVDLPPANVLFAMDG